MNQFTAKKKKNQVVFNYITDYLPWKSSKRFKECATYMDMATNADMTKFKVLHANFCKHRFCPVCSYVKSMKLAYKLHVMTKYITHEHGYRYIFVTLTAPNVSGDKLSEEITRYNKAFDKFVQLPAIKDISQGFIRKLEITYNGDRRITKEYYAKAKKYCDARGLRVGMPNPNYDTYHTHFHVIFAVKSNYFTSRDYIPKSMFLLLWQRCMQDKSITQVHVQSVKDNASRNLHSGIYEMAKYSAKDSDYARSQAVFDVFYEALKGRREITFGGIFREARDKFDNDELKDFETPADMSELCWRILYSWVKGQGQYKERRKEEFSFEEFKAQMLLTNPEWDELGSISLVDKDLMEAVFALVEGAS
jgi:plasmid rolling circle replication initiator protein Rep